MSSIVVVQPEYTIEGPVTVSFKQGNNENLEIKIHKESNLFSLEERVLRYNGKVDALPVVVTVLLPRHGHVHLELNLKGVKGVVNFGKAMIFSDATSIRIIDPICPRVNLCHLHVFAIEVSCKKPVFIRDCVIKGTITCTNESNGGDSGILLNEVRMNHLVIVSPKSNVFFTDCFFVNAFITAKCFYSEGQSVSVDLADPMLRELRQILKVGKVRKSRNLMLFLTCIDSRVTITGMSCHRVHVRYACRGDYMKRTIITECEIEKRRF